jgi:hypothetical protein
MGPSGSWCMKTTGTRLSPLGHADYSENILVFQRRLTNNEVFTDVKTAYFSLYCCTLLMYTLRIMLISVILYIVVFRAPVYEVVAG